MRLLAILATGISLVAASAHHPRDPQVCNTRAEYCSRKYSNVTFVGAHDSAFVGPIADPRVNQEVNITGQLDAGIRVLEAQTHVLNGELSMCHTSCAELYAGSLASYLTSIKQWLDAHPDDVVSLFISNGDFTNATSYDTVFKATGIDKYAYVPPTSPNKLAIGDWPTYACLITAGSRFVVFMDYKADEVAVPYLLDQFQYYFATPYDTTDPNFPECDLDQPRGSSPDGQMYVVNHFLDTNLLGTGILIPDNAADYQTNAATGNGSIGAQADLCTSIYGRVPNVIFVDFFDRGDIFTAQNTLNGVK